MFSNKKEEEKINFKEEEKKLWEARDEYRKWFKEQEQKIEEIKNTIFFEKLKELLNKKI